MLVINARNVNDALKQGLNLLEEYGQECTSRAGRVLEIQEPVATVYNNPWEMVLLSKSRDANPFFHLFESLWILAGRMDVGFLTEFNKQMSEYSDNGITFNAPYGFRMRNGINSNYDQISSVIDILNTEPDSRQAVIQIWDDVDLNKETKDKACNMSVVFKIRKDKNELPYLDITVYNRSNDMIWGAYGANVVQFSMLQQYVASALELPMGTYTQVSNSFHVYLDGKGGEVYNRVKNNIREELNFSYDNLSQVYNVNFDCFNSDLRMFFRLYDKDGLRNCIDADYRSNYFNYVVVPMLRTYLSYKYGHPIRNIIDNMHNIVDDAWKLAADIWLNNRKSFNEKL